jgi:aspartate aminotransferase
MLPEQMLAWGYTRNCIREVMEYGTIRKQEIGAENVYDYSIGNPSIPAPDCVNEAIAELIRGDSVALHGYTTAAGLPSVRAAIAKNLNDTYDLGLTGDLFYITCGCASSIAIALRAVLFPGDEVIVNAPFFPEYRVFTEASRGVVRVVPPRSDFQIDFDALKNALSEKTKAVIINSPNNPSGMVYSEETLKELSAILRAHEEKIGETVYLLTDEPYRELVYDMDKAPNAMCYYDDTFICYSFSKCMSIPGERIGYLAVSPRMHDKTAVYAAVLGAGRALGYINPPSLFQRVIEKTVGAHSDFSQYKLNRDILTAGLREIGYDCVDPRGAFYLFAKALEPDAKAFCEHAKKYELLLVPSNDFGMTGYFRMAYCVDREMIRKSMPAFKALWDDYHK